MYTYVVKNYDTVTYAGPNKQAAIAKNAGSTIWVWQDGKQMGWLVYIGKKWQLKKW